MTATSVFTPTTSGGSWSTIQRVVVIVLVLAACVAVGFAAGRISARNRVTRVITPAASLSPVDTSEYPCRIGRPC